MPWPNFSELSFGFAFLREFERRHLAGGSFPAAPEFISQHAEAKKGYDVKVLNGTTPVFFQFKRSFLLTTRRAREIQAGHFTGPDLYRMYLHEKDSYAQHKALRNLQRDGNEVHYVTSQVDSLAALTRTYRRRTVLDRATALFSPLEIDLPDFHKRHYVTFEADADFGYVYSEEGTRFERKFPRWEVAVENAFQRRRRSTEENIEALAAISRSLAARSREARQVADQFDDPVIKASVLAFLVLDAQLTFFKE